MSFASDIKAELSRRDIKKSCDVLSELCAIAHSVGTIELGIDGMKLRFDVESNTVARRIYRLVKFRYKVLCDTRVVEGKRLNKHDRYRVYLNDSEVAKQLLHDTGILLQDAEGTTISEIIPGSVIEHTCCKRTFLAGIFLTSGYANNPETSYHCEFYLKDEQLAKSVLTLLHSEDFDAKLITRKGSYVVYLNSGDSICDLLSLIGAHNAVLAMQNIRAMHELRNDVNRRINFDTANINKASAAATKQIRDIGIIESADKYSTLSAELKQAAELRMDNPGASLQELADMLSDVTKSGMNHRFRKIAKIASSIIDD